MRRITFATAAIVALALCTTPARAAFVVRAEIDGAGFTIEVEDNQAGDGDPDVGALSVSLSPLNGVAGSLTFSLSKPIIGSSLQSKIDISIDGVFDTAGSHTLVVDVTDTDFGPPSTPSGLGVLTAELGGGGFADLTSFSFQAWLDNANNEFGIPGSFGTIPITTPLGTASIIGTSDGQYSITARTIITGDQGDDFSFDNHVTFTPVPEPTTMAIWSMIGGIGAVAGWRRSRRKA